MAKIHHEIWLQAHPHRTRVWLRERLAEGFEIHHVDGVHENNSPDNLVLVEGRDHMLLHMGHRPDRVRKLPDKVIAAQRVSYAIGKAAYKLRTTGLRWKAVAHELSRNKVCEYLGASAVTNKARRYASVYKKPWPIEMDNISVIET